MIFLQAAVHRSSSLAARHLPLICTLLTKTTTRANLRCISLVGARKHRKPRRRLKQELQS
jgi:hypothetical protein